MANDCTFRKACATDDVARIAKYLHLTDPYIYPVVCPDPEDGDWVRLIEACLAAKDNFYSLEHLSVALADGKIVGAACVVPCGKKLAFSEGLTLPDAIKAGVARVVAGYFGPLAEENAGLSGYNLINICVDEAYRGRGVGAAFMAHLLSLYGDKEIHLDVVADNAAAIHTYEKCGFAVTREYLGFSGGDDPLPCLHMVKPAKM
ncbi:MAG: GNAT family N-acetyltransferase [Clostridia bacterium]|nr:GNAT family N-acetyltransferase [Clostridia bacterium]